MDTNTLYDDQGIKIYRSSENSEGLSARVKTEMDFSFNIPAEFEGKEITDFVIDTAYLHKPKVIVLPSTIKNISFDFEKDDSSEGFSVLIKPENPWFVSDNKAVFTKDMSKIVLFTSRDDNTYKLPESVRVIGKYAFADARNLNEIILPEGLEKIEEHAFFHSGLENLILPDSVKVVEKNAFEQTKLSQIKLSKNLEVIKENSFRSVYHVNKLHFHSDLREIGSCALPDIVDTYKVDKANDFFTVRDGILYTKDMQTVVRASQSIGEKAVIPDGVKTVGKNAFANIKKIKEVWLPSSIDTIDANAFAHCTDLEKVQLGNTKFIGKQAFLSCRSLKETELPEGLEEIGAEAFYRTSIKRVIIPKSVKKIGRSAFSARYVELYDVDPSPVADFEYFSGIDHLLTVRSPETNDIKFAVPFYYSEWCDYSWELRQIVMMLFNKKTSSYAFDLYDYLFLHSKEDELNFRNSEYIYYGCNDIEEYFKGKIYYKDEFFAGRYMAAHYRLEYPLGITPEARSMYDRYLSDYADDVFLLMLKKDNINIGEIKDFPYLNRIDEEKLNEFIVLSRKLGRKDIARYIKKYMSGMIPWQNNVFFSEYEEENALISSENKRKFHRMAKRYDMEQYLKNAEQGDADAQYETGIRYQYGEGVQRDSEKAVMWITKSAEQGYAKALAKLAEYYLLGEMVKQDKEKSLEYSMKAIDQGSTQAMCELARQYFIGKVFERNIHKAIELYIKAYKLGSRSAGISLKQWCYYNVRDDESMDENEKKKILAMIRDLNIL